MKRSSLAAGFTIVELAVVLAIMSMLIGIATINLSSLQNRTNVSSTLNTLISDLRKQQLKAMVGDSDGGASPHSYGVHFNTTSYVLFQGNAYVPGANTNTTIDLESQMTFPSDTISLPNNNSVIFNQVSGEMNGYTAALHSLVLRSPNNGESKTIQFNRYGVITLIN